MKKNHATYNANMKLFFISFVDFFLDNYYMLLVLQLKLFPFLVLQVVYGKVSLNYKALRSFVELEIIYH